MSESYDLILAEDNPSDAELIMRVLRKTGVAENILHVDDGAQLLDYVFATGMYEGRNAAECPKLIIMDLKMPRVDGLEALKQIRAQQQTKSIPVVLLTSSQEPDDVQTAYALGVNSYVVKPMDFDNFMKIISSIGMYWLGTNYCCR
ncbi:MAG: response regulator [Agriterribacter sp.]